MPILAINHFNVRAPQDVIEAVRDFYINVLGLRLGDRPAFRSQGFWLYADAQPLVHLSIADATAPRRTGAASTLDHIAFECAGFDATREHLAALGLDFELAEVPGLGYRQIFLKDPANNGVELNFAGA